MQRRRQSRLFDFTSSCDVAIYGGGFGGLYTALKIFEENPSLDVRLVTPTDSFVFLPLLYDLVVGTATEREVCPFYSDLFRNTRIRHIKDSLESLNGTTALLKSGDSLQAEHVVIAVGAAPVLETVEGSEYVQPFYTLTDALETRQALNRYEERDSLSRIAVVGGGYGGVELCACLARRFPHVSIELLCRQAPLQGTRAESWVNDALVSLGVDIRLNSSVVSVMKEEANVTVRCENGDAGPFDAVFWTAGSRPSRVVERLHGLQTTEGRLVTDQNLRCKSTLHEVQPIWALGDCAVSTTPVPKTAQVAMQQADVVASNILAGLNDQPGKVFIYQDLGSMLTLGGPNAAVLAPDESQTFGPVFAPILESVNSLLSVGDQIATEALQNSASFSELQRSGLSLGSHGLLGANSNISGSWVGTLSGTARRAVYAARMPTNEQRVLSLVSAAVSTTASLIQEQRKRNG